MFQTALGTALGLGVALGVAYIGYRLLQRVGYVSYLGLPPGSGGRVLAQLDQNCHLLSRACGTRSDGVQFCRGIHTGCGPMLYHHHNVYPDGTDDLDLYHLPDEWWSSQWPDTFATTGQLVFP